MRAAIITTAAVAGLALCAGARAQENTAQATIFGIGRLSCADWMANAMSERDGADWAMGFWSGLNVNSITDRQVGHTGDGESILGEIKELCAEHPSMRLAEATVHAYDMLAAQHR
jgi:hypothetical protein